MFPFKLPHFLLWVQGIFKSSLFVCLFGFKSEIESEREKEREREEGGLISVLLKKYIWNKICVIKAFIMSQCWMMKKWAMEMKQSQVFKWAKWGKSHKLFQKGLTF